MPIHALSHLTFIVRDLDRAARFFCDGLGAHEVYDSAARNFSRSREKFFELGGLWLVAMQGEPPAERSYQHVAFAVSDGELPAYEARLRAIGADILPPRPRVEGEGQSLYVHDFDNHLFELHTGTLSERLARYRADGFNDDTGPMKPALIIIDVQQGLCEGAGAAFDCAGTIARINRLADAARAADVPVVWIQHEAQDELRHGTREWQLADGLAVHAGDLRVRKTTPDSFNRTNLDAMLRERSVDTLIICGMHTEFCVDTTCRRALALGYPVRLAADAHTSAGNAALSPAQVIAHHNATLTAISSFGPRVQAWPTTALVADLAASAPLRG